MSIHIKSSTGQVIDNPGVDVVVYSLFDDPSAWTRTPDATITHTENGTPSSLIVAYAEGIGYYVHLLDKSRRIWLLVENPVNISPEVVEIDEDYSISAGLLCKRSIAEDAVRWFVTHGDKAPNLKWLSDFDLPDNVAF